MKFKKLFCTFAGHAFNSYRTSSCVGHADGTRHSGWGRKLLPGWFLFSFFLFFLFAMNYDFDIQLIGCSFQHPCYSTLIPSLVSQALQVLSEYLQILEGYSELSAVQEMGRGIEVSNFSIAWVLFLGAIFIPFVMWLLLCWSNSHFYLLVNFKFFLQI